MTTPRPPAPLTPPTPPPAVFLDRDGTLIRDVGYLSEPDQVIPIPGADAAMQHLLEHGFLLFLHTNQSGIGRGYFSRDDVDRANRRMLHLLGLHADVFADVCIAPETSEDPPLYRKPSPRFQAEMIARHHLDPKRCWMIGDSRVDLLTAVHAGIRPLLVQTGITGDPASWPETSQHHAPVFPSVLDAVSSIIPRA